jgi:NAD(P)-dependent dehydrogenase (short-subunit alcohol dehydrogenase family)
MPAEPAGDGTLLGWAFDEAPDGNGGGNRGTGHRRPGGGGQAGRGARGHGDGSADQGHPGGSPRGHADASAAYGQTDYGQTEHGQMDNGHAGTGALAPGAWRGWDDEPADLGLRGLIRTVAAEYPGVLARAVDVEAKSSPREIAAQLLTELSVPAGPSVVGYLAGRRTGLRVVEVAPPGTGLAGSPGLGLNSDSVVLLTGGARGITAAAALALARATGCHIELIGRTPPPGPADPELDTADPVALRQVLIARGGLNGRRGPREIEAETARLLRERQVRGTLDRLRATAASVRYHAADVRDAASVGAVLADVYARFGRIDGVIHGAGVVEDRLIADKTPDSFTRVYRTKVDGARALAAGLRGDVRFLVLFGSVSGVFGNRGQADYAAANDALDALARHWSLRTGHGGVPGDDRQGGRGTAAAGGPRVLAVDWGPWAGGGMISPELEREYARRGVPLIDPADGVTCLLAEIADPAGPAQVVYLCGELPQPGPGQSGNGHAGPGQTSPGQTGPGQPGRGQSGNGNAGE